ncbi:hypothetical protein RclHR1_00700028 [Rhizophagus clarus]|uniref:F-box domain-containing protein n=1 Tax=Rhizophagus clarus TaxID=94130 RepID=A0A2Z6SKC7_9GLOM|nr:hypothetical protein RclHR1_00700028 [Rhizophagus clarus]GES99841.1 hypothetical protein GLOIN_2v1845686 [Rhizophagus clarus]
MSKLPLETIEEILSYIDEDDIRTFRSLSLINKTWCSLSIPHLWKKPFNLKQHESKNHYKIITIILSYLDEQQKTVLKLNEKKTGIFLSTKLLYNYPSYIRQIDFNKLFLLITEWIIQNKKFRTKFKENYFIKNSDKFSFDFSIFKEDEEDYELNFSYNHIIERCCLNDQEKLAFFEYIFKIIITRSRGIKKLVVEIYHENEEIAYTIPKDFFKYLFGLKDVGKCFAGLNEFSCKGNFHKIWLINGIKKYSHEIRILTIFPWNRNYVNDLRVKDLKGLLKAQKYLKSLSFSVDSEIEKKVIECMQGNTLKTLESFQMQYGDLTNKDLKSLSKCKKLKRLYFDTVYFDESINILGKVLFPDLEELIFFNCNFSSSCLDLLKDFIKINGSHLKNFQLCQNIIENNLDIDDLLSSLSISCSKLSKFYVNIDNQSDIPSFFKILKQFKNSLKFINVGNYNNGKPKLILNDDLMMEFIDIFMILSNIIHLDLSNWGFSFDIFKILIKKCCYSNVKVFKVSCLGGTKEDLECLIESNAKLNSRTLDHLSIIENDEIKNIKIVWN